MVLFNVDEDYFECHEAMEELWLEEGRSALYQGLLQAAVGLHHWRNDNYSGAVKLFVQAENKLSVYPEVAMGLDLRQLRADMARCLSLLRAHMERSTSSDEPAKPPAFRAFRLIVKDAVLQSLADALAVIPPSQRLHHGD
ncbi:DUF309 domain-containing protein [Paenibacillus sp. T1]|uniref:DUF309 domain-containing protein n=1 Tax=Paenibacillus glycinis TaxID=2697035 RepID=A0ABW9XTP0_9BACL|nr:DUF309 domain-containing protein [Paenibacillus glycinis]